MREKTIRIGKGRYKGTDNTVIQRAVDELAAEGGGTVELPAATFEMADALHLKSGVKVIGQGRESVLRKALSVTSPLADYLGYGHYEITLAQPDLFRPGMGVLILDDNAGGFYTTQASLLGRSGNAFFIDRPLAHDYHPSKSGRVISIFPLVTGQYVKDVAIYNVTLDGANDPVQMNGCRGGGIFLLQAHTVSVEALEVVNYNGDAVSFQQSTDVAVRDCHLHHNTGTGLHPGSGTVRYLMVGNQVHDNGGDGLFYCLRTTHSRCAGNKLYDNAGVGISIGERDTDHVIYSNDIRGNGGPAVLFREVSYRGGDRVVLEVNRFIGNCRKKGEAEVVIAAGINSVELRGNAFEQTKGKAVKIGASARDVYLAENTIDGKELALQDLDDLSGKAVFGERKPPLKVGPGAADNDSARHLAMELPERPANFET